MPPVGATVTMTFGLLMLVFSREELGLKGMGDYGGMAQLVRARAIAWAHSDRALGQAQQDRQAADDDKCSQGQETHLDTAGGALDPADQCGADEAAEDAQ